MDQKIAKIFSYFTDIKHQNLFSLCLLQLVEAYDDSPQALKPILYNLKTLFFPNTKESRLRLKQRQLAASIIEKIIAKHTLYLDSFLNNNNIQQMENFHIEEGAPETLQNHINTYQNLSWDAIPFAQIIQTRPLLLASDKKFKQSEEELKRIEAEFFEKLSDAKTATATNINIFLGDLTSLQQGDTKTQEEETNKPTKHQKKIEKLKRKTQQSFVSKSTNISVFNPMNFIYQFGIQNAMSPNWETRHLSVLLLKAIVPWLKYIGFNFSFQIKDLSKEQAFPILYQVCKKQMKKFLQQSKQGFLKRELVFQSTLVLSLDRFADYQAQRSNIMVRSVTAKVLAFVYQTLSKNQQTQILRAVQNLLEHKSSQDDPLAPFAWQLRHSFIFWIYLVMEQPKNRQHIFNMFNSTFIFLLTKIDEDEVILTLCQCLSLLSCQRFFTIDYAREVNNMLWDIIANLDDISYSATKIFALLTSNLHLVQIDELDCLIRLKQFFTNRTQQVRKQFYNLQTEIFSKNFKVSTKQNYRISDIPPTINNIIPWSAIQFMQEIMVEQHIQNLEALVHFGASLFPYLLADAEESMLAQFCSNVVCVYQPIQNVIKTQFINKDNYKFICDDQRADLLNDHMNIRIWKMSEVIGEMLVYKQNNLTQRVLEPFILLGTDLDTRFLLITLGIICSSFRASPQTAQNCNFLLDFVEKILKMQSHQMNTSVINIYEGQFQSKLEEYMTTIDDPAEIQLCNLNINNKTWDKRSKLHTVLLQKYSQNPSNDLHILISCMQTIVEIQKDLVKHLKILASYCYCSIVPNQQPKPLNLIIKSVQQNLKQERYFFISKITQSCMSKLSRILLIKNKSIFTKFNTNTLNQIATKYELKTTNIQRKKAHFQIDSTRMQALSGYISQIGRIDPGWLKDFEGCFLKGFETTENLKPCLNLLEGTIHGIVAICDELFLHKLLKYLGNQLQNNSQDNLEQLNSIVQKMLINYTKQWKLESNIFLEWFVSQMSVSLPIIKVLRKTLQNNVAKISSICCIFLLQSIRLMTGGGDFRQPAMGCLSNLLMGAFVSTSKPEFSPKLDKLAQKGLSFVRDFKNINNFQYKIEMKQKLQLRSYQLQGVKWLGFLVKYYLNGALCDDMGLGKTLQTLTVIQNQYYKSSHKQQVSLIVVPSTLIQHWKYQYTKYFSEGCLRPHCIFNKNDVNLIALQEKKIKYNLVITSYALIEKAVSFFENTKFKFIILDEGHLVKNPKTNKFKALAKLQADHKFILSGTPIQNKLLELWGIFQFLMPGYLGTQESFKIKYNKLFNVNLMTFKEDDLLFNKDQKQALEALHIKVMPFILRRLKKQVLKQLPDKIMQDYLCKMVPLQQHLYMNFHKQLSKGKFNVEDYGKEESSALSILNQMRKIVNHPNLVGEQLGYDASGKFLALKDLFDDMCFQNPSSVTNKIIVFSRFNATLDLIQSLLLQKLYPEIKFSKLTGTVPQNRRFDVAQQFNDSYDIKVLLTTTSIGGYGLNLTSANVVIMFDHDYNPSVDMQAIDRAHRLGQKNVLNVYRLIMKDTLEEKIMGIQRFKNNLASAIVNLDNASIKNIQDSKLPDLLQKISLIQETEKKRVGKSLYATMINEMEKDAIEIEDYEVQY